MRQLQQIACSRAVRSSRLCGRCTVVRSAFSETPRNSYMISDTGTRIGVPALETRTRSYSFSIGLLQRIILLIYTIVYTISRNGDILTLLIYQKGLIRIATT